MAFLVAVNVAMISASVLWMATQLCCSKLTVAGEERKDKQIATRCINVRLDLYSSLHYQYNYCTHLNNQMKHISGAPLRLPVRLTHPVVGGKRRLPQDRQGTCLRRNHCQHTSGAYLDCGSEYVNM